LDQESNCAFSIASFGRQIFGIALWVEMGAVWLSSIHWVFEFGIIDFESDIFWVFWGFGTGIEFFL
jgi:hypothetical protein